VNSKALITDRNGEPSLQLQQCLPVTLLQQLQLAALAAQAVQLLQLLLW
jgi:hypothetical protein